MLLHAASGLEQGYNNVSVRVHTTPRARSGAHNEEVIVEIYLTHGSENVDDGEARGVGAMLCVVGVEIETGTLSQL